MNDVERELRDMLERKAGSVGGVAPRLPEAVRKRGRRRQAGTGAIGAFTVAAVALVSFAGLRSIDLGAGNTRVPGGNRSDRYEVFERTATIETITLASPSNWYLMNQWPLGAQVATSAGSSSTSCVTNPGPGAPDLEDCSDVSPVQFPATDAPLPLLLLSNADLGLGASPCLEGGIELTGSAAMLAVALNAKALQQIEAGVGPDLPTWPVAFDENAVTDGPCGSGHYVHFQVGANAYIAWVGFGPEASDDVRRSLFDMANRMQIEDVDLQGPSDETPGYVIASGENAAGPWRLELRPSTSEGPDANIDLHLIGSEGGGPGVADFTVPDATPIESGGGDPTFGVVTKEASGVELRLEEGTPPIPATLVPLPPSLAYPFDLFFASNPSDVPAVAVPLGIDPARPSIASSGQSSKPCEPLAGDTSAHTVIPSNGTSGTSAEIHLAIPTRGENGQYIPPSGEVQIWWNLDPSEWPTAFPGSDPPKGERKGDVLLLGSFSAEGRCVVDGTITIPEASPGTYTVVAINADMEGANMILPPGQQLMFTVTG